MGIRINLANPSQNEISESKKEFKITGTSGGSYDLDQIIVGNNRNNQSAPLSVKVYTLEEINTLAVNKIKAKILLDYNAESENDILNYENIYANYYSRYYDLYRDDVISEHEGNISITNVSTSIELSGHDYREYLLSTQNEDLGVLGSTAVFKIPEIQSENYILDTNLSAEEKAALLSHNPEKRTFSPPQYNNHPNTIFTEGTIDNTTENGSYDEIVEAVSDLINRVDTLEDEKVIWISHD